MNESISKSDADDLSTDPPILDLVICPYCQAAVARGAANCWLCQSSLGLNPYEAVATDPEAVPNGSEALLVSLSIGCVGLAAIVAIGLASGSPGLIVILLMAALPAFAIAWPQLNRSSVAGRVRASDVAKTVLLSLALTIGILGLVFVAAVVLLFFFCLYAINAH